MIASIIDASIIEITETVNELCLVYPGLKPEQVDIMTVGDVTSFYLKPKQEENEMAGQAKPKEHGITVEQVLAKYVETRDKIAEIEQKCKTETDELKAKQKAKEKWLMGKMQELGVDSFKSAAGTCFITTKDSAKVADRDAFLSWVHEDWETRQQYLENRVSKAAVKQDLEDKKPVPPGVDYSTFKDVQVRRK